MHNLTATLVVCELSIIIMGVSRLYFSEKMSAKTRNLQRILKTPRQEEFRQAVSHCFMMLFL